MRKFALAASVAVAALVAGSGAWAEGTVAVIVKATTSEYWQWVFKGAQAAAKDLGIKVDELGSPKDDAAAQISILENAAGNEAAGDRDFADHHRGARRSGRSGDQGRHPGHRHRLRRQHGQLRVVPDHQQRRRRQGRGRRHGDSASRSAPARSPARSRFITAMAGHESLDSRDKGFQSKASRPIRTSTIVGNRVANNEEAEGMSLTADMLTKDPDLVGIFADNAQMGTGAGASIAEQKLGDKLCLVAFDSDAGELEHLKDGSIYALIIQDPYMMGYAGVWYGYAAAHGVRLPKDVDTGVGTVTKANMDDPAFAGLLDVTKRKLSPFVGN